MFIFDDTTYSGGVWGRTFALFLDGRSSVRALRHLPLALCLTPLCMNRAVEHVNMSLGCDFRAQSTSIGPASYLLLKSLTLTGKLTNSRHG